MPTPIQQRRPKHSRELVNLDEPEMVMQLAELDMTAEVKTATVTPLSAYDWLTELNSAASMIMDREECEALAKELELMGLQHTVAA